MWKVERLTDGTYRCMIRFGTKQRRRFRINATGELEAAEREAVLIALGATIGRAKIDAALGARLLSRAGAGDVRGARAAVAALVAGVRAHVPTAGVPRTMRELGQLWTSGALAERFPDHVRTKATSDRDAQRLRLLCRSIGDVPVSRFALADAELAMAALPRTLSSATRRQYAQILARLCHLAVYPLRLIAVSPLPRGFLPKVRRAKATAWLYPSEDASLLACTAVPLARRLLYGVLAREGLRLGEALRLRWQDLDLERGTIRLDRNKTDDPRAWALAPGVAAALARFRGEADGFVWLAQVRDHMADQFRADLRAAGVDRAELFERSPARQPIRVHDLRATFVTLSLAAGRSETWVADRTGHRSSVMIAGYRRTARTAAELGLDELAALDVATERDTTRPVRQL